MFFDVLCNNLKKKSASVVVCQVLAVTLPTCFHGQTTADVQPGGQCPVQHTDTTA